MTESIALSLAPFAARTAELLAWCDALAGEPWMTAAERELVRRLRSQLVSPVDFFISQNRQDALAALVAKIRPTGAIH